MLINNRYQVIRPLGEGGFGHAYLAEDTQMPSRRRCVIKQLKPITTSPEVYQVVQDRFQREAAILEQLGENHRQIPRLHAYFTEDQKFYLVQEWIEGETLEEMTVPMPEKRVLDLMVSLLPVLQFIHNKGIIHRDLKPENIILRSGTYQPVLIDFGAVRETMGTVMNSRNNPTSSIVIGTPGYMSAEQAAGRPIPSSDLYSLGLTAVFLLTGQMPQNLRSDVETGELIWQQAAGHVSPGLLAIIDRAIRSHPRDRYTTASEMLGALTTLPDVSVNDAAVTAVASPPTPASAPPPAASQLKTRAVAPAAQPPAFTASTQSQSPQTTVSQPAAANPGFSSQPALNNGGAAPSRTRRLTPLTVGLIVAAVGGSAIAGGLMMSQLNRDTTVQPVVSEPRDTGEEGETEGGQEGDRTADTTGTDERNSDSRPPETTPPTNPPDEPDPNPVLVPNPVPIDPALARQVALRGANSDRIDVYEQPSFDAASPHYGVGGDRVFTAGETYSGNDGTQWTRILFESGAEGWVPQSVIVAVTAPPPTTPPVDPPVDPPPNLENVPKFTVLAGPSSERINVRSAPSTSASSPHYGVGGDPVQILDVARGADGYDWYAVAFESGAEGWVRSDLIQLP